jgi:glycerophosphoryl diester phosphodiesterase
MPMMRATLAVGLAAAILGANPSSGVVAAPCAPSPFRSSPPVIIAHASGDYFGPPNTIEMMRGARRAGADVLDADVRVTRDGALVASHDDIITVGPTRLSIAKSTLAEVQQLDLGSAWPGPKKDFPLRNSLGHKSHARIPTIEAILAAFPKTRFSFEFKVAGGGSQLCALLRSAKRTGDVYVSSEGDAGVDEVNRSCPEVVTTVTDALVVDIRRARDTGAAWCSPAPIGQPALRRGDRSLDVQRVQWSHDHGMAVYTWTADDRPTLQSAIALGVDGIYTARPDLARALLARAKH